MKHPVAFLAVFFTSCATALPITQTNPLAEPVPIVAPATESPTSNPNRWVYFPISTPTPAPSPYPIALFFAQGASLVSLVNTVKEEADAWNEALGWVAITEGGPGHRVLVELTPKTFQPGTANEILGEVDDLYYPTKMQLYAGMLQTDYLKGTVLHELGHLIGCLHSGRTGNVMSNPNMGLATLTPADIYEGQLATGSRKAQAEVGNERR